MSLYVNLPGGSAPTSGATSSAPLSGDGSSGTPLTIAAASAAAPGTMSIADFNKLATVPTGAGLCCWGKTATIDFLAVAADYTMNIPAMAGTELVGVVGRLRVVTRTGVATGNLNYSIGNNATKDNFILASQGLLTAASINAAGAAAGGVLALLAGPQAIDMSAGPMVLRMQTIPTGLTAFSGYVDYSVMYVPFP